MLRSVDMAEFFINFSRYIDEDSPVKLNRKTA